MAYLDNTEITVDAILTKKGRQKLASGQSLNITKFALGDDEIDYTLYNSANKKGPNYYNSAILAPTLSCSSSNIQYLLDEFFIASRTSSCIKDPVIIVNVAFALMKVRTPNSLNKSLFAAAATPAGKTEAAAFSPDKIPPANGRTLKPFIRSLRFI